MATESLSLEISEIGNIQDDLLNNRTRYDGDVAAWLYKSAQTLKDIAYLLEEKYLKGKHIVVLSEKYRNLNKFKELVGKFSTVVNGYVDEQLQQVVIDEINEYSTSLSEKAFAKNIEHDEEIKRLRDQVEEYEKVVAQMRTKARTVDDEVDKLQSKVAKVDTYTEELTSVAEGRATKEWADEYLEYVSKDEAYKQKLGANIDVTSERLQGSVGIEYVWFWIVKNLWLKILCNGYRVSCQERIFYSGKSYENLVLKWRATRTFWFLCLTSLAIAYIWHALSYSFDTREHIETFFISKLIYAPLVVLATIGFTFSSKNLRINAHLLEQYKHRYIVAKTLNNLMTLDDLKGDGAIKNELIQQGSKTLFEFRQSGYMNKHEDDSTLLQEVMTLIKPASK